jgi:imidazolonepropionase
MSINPQVTLLVEHIGQLVTMRGKVPRVGPSMRELDIINDGAVAVSGETIIAVGPTEQIRRSVSLAGNCTVLEAPGAVVTPGLVDPHTHPVFSATREDEFEMRLQGKTYMEIADAGGGIRRSVRDLRTTPGETLKQKTLRRLDRFLSYGVTTIEAKSGYGLSTESELRQLQIIRDLSATHPLEMVPTFLGAHDFPDEFRSNPEGYVQLIIDEMIPAVAMDQLAEFSDIFCEKGVFSIDQSRRIQQAAASHGLKLKFHADELTCTGGAELAASMHAVSADHLVYASDDGIRALANSGTAAVLLPGTTFSLGGTQYARARTMIDAGVVVAISTDCNPGSSNSESMPMIISLAAVVLRMTAAEALTAATVNAAHAVSRSDRIGILDKTYQADFVIWDMADYRELPYHYGVNLANTVIKKGRVVVG